MNKTICWSMLFILCVFSGNGRARQNRNPGKNPGKGNTTYLGLTAPGNIPELFAPGIVSTGMNEAYVTISPDGGDIFFGNVNPPYAVIVQIKIVNRLWQQPRVAPFSGSYSDQAPMVSPDGKRLFFVSSRPLSGEGKPDDNTDIWFVTKTPGGWSAPQKLGDAVNSPENEGYVSVSESGNLYFVRSIRNKFRTTSDLYRAECVEGHYQKAEKLGPTVNSELIEADPFISPDEGYLIFASEGRDDSLGWVDLYISFRQKDGSWSKAVNMGNRVNSDGEEFNPFVSPDGRFHFFNRHIRTKKYSEDPMTYKEKKTFLDSPRNGLGDIFWMKTDVIERLRSNQ